MDFDQAVVAHSAWKQKLVDYLSKRDGSQKVSEVSVDNKCPLGQWIHGEGSKYASLPEYSTLKNEHARFHKAAADVIRRADSGESIVPETALGPKSEYGTASATVVLAIMSMKKQAAK
jgi:methyl-accepting chemotaxis protein